MCNFDVVEELKEEQIIMDHKKKINIFHTPEYFLATAKLNIHLV